MDKVNHTCSPAPGPTAHGGLMYVFRLFAALGLALSPVAEVLSATTDLSDVPLRTMNRAKPNILIALDNGGNTVRAYSPDTAPINMNNYRISSSYVYRDGTGSSGWPYYRVQFPYTKDWTSGHELNTGALSSTASVEDNDWHYRANDCVPIISGSTQTGTTCPVLTSSNFFNRLYFRPDYIYSAPADYQGRTLPTPAQVQAAPSTYSWYLNTTTYPTALNGCTAGNTSIDSGTWTYSLSTATDGVAVSSYDTCAWIDGFHPEYGTVNLRNNFSTYNYPLINNQLQPAYMPKMAGQETVRPDGVVLTTAYDNYPATVGGGGFAGCTSTQNVAILCLPGTQPTTPGGGSRYVPNCSRASSSTVSQAWFWSGCSANDTGGTLSGPSDLGTLTTLPSSIGSPYYCDLSYFYNNSRGQLYSDTSSTAFIMACVMAKKNFGQTIYANPGPADYFDTSGARYPLVTNSGGSYVFGWSSTTISRFVLWHSFYRTRLLALKSSLSVAVDGAGLNSNFRVGLATVLNGDSSLPTSSNYFFGASTTASKHYFSAVADFDSSHKQEWFQQLQKVSYGPASASPDYLSNLHAYYLWFTGTWPDPAVPTGYVSQSAANSTNNSGADSQYAYDTTGAALTHYGPSMYSCQNNVLAFVASSVVAYVGQRISGLATYVPSSISSSTYMPNITGSGSCNDAFSSTSSNYTNTVCDIDAGTPSLPTYLSASNSYGSTGLGYFYDPTACKSGDSAACTGTNINTTDTAWPAPIKANAAIGLPSGVTTTSPYGIHYGGRTGSLSGSSFSFTQSSMAQLALYYWARDLNEEFNYQRTGTRSGSTPIAINYIPTWDGSGNRLGDRRGVPTFGNDLAYWPHVTTYMVSLGVAGSYDYSSTSAQNPINNAGTSSHVDWPAIYYDTSAAEYLTSADDMAHAAVAGHGRFLSAYDSSTLKSAFSTMFTDILSLSGSQSAVAVANTQISQSGSNYAFQSSYNSSGWSGDLVASPINSSTGAINSYAFGANTCVATSDTNTGWSASCALRKQLCNNGTYTCTNPGADTSVRYIVTDKGTSSGAGVEFTASSIATGISNYNTIFGTSSTDWTATDTTGALLDYLRGNSASENCAASPSSGYRCRYSGGSNSLYWYPLGDSVDAEAVVIGPPQITLADTGFTAFKSTMQTAFSTSGTGPVVFQAANDGMLHAFKVGNGTTADSTRGSESWAYVPGSVLSSINNLASHSYSHQYYVNATPSFGYVDTTNGVSAPIDGSSWKTLLVGGLGKGGRSYYALNVTSPNATSQSNAASKVAWVFPNGATSSTDVAKIGYTYGRPAIVKIADGTGSRWVVLVSSGYNNTDGVGRLFVLDAADGSVLATVDTPCATMTSPYPAAYTACSSSNPAGFSFFVAQVSNPNSDHSLVAVYGGDLLGNVWKISQSGTAVSSWTATRLAYLTDSTGAMQPVTTEPEIAVTDYGTALFIGTGRYLGTSDIPTSQLITGRQTVYALDVSKAGSSTYTGSSGARSAISANQRLIDATSSSVFSASNCTPTSSSNRCLASGQPPNPVSAAQTSFHWAFDLPVGERIITNPVLALGALIFTASQPQSDPCQPGGKSYQYILDYLNGGSIGTGSAVSQTILDPTTGYNVMAARPTIIQLPDGRVTILQSVSVGTTLQVQNVLSQPARRMTWREVPNTN